MQWPDDEISGLIAEDLQPLFEQYPDGQLLVPDGVFDEEPAAPLSNGTVHALPWEFVATTPVQRQGLAREPRTFTIRGVTIFHEGTETFRRYVDWAGVWAQFGTSSGRGESDDRALINQFNQLPARDQRLLDPTGADVTEQLLGPQALD